MSQSELQSREKIQLMPDVLYFNGRFTTTDEKVIGVEDRGFQFADAIYEVIKFLGKRPLFVDDHFARLQRGLADLEIQSPWDRETYQRVIDELLDRTSFDDGILYFQVTRGESERAHFYPESIAPTAVAYSRRFRFPDAVKKRQGIRVVTLPDIRWSYCDVKSVNLLGSVLAKKKAQRAGADEALFVSDGEVTEGASSSFFGVRKGVVFTRAFDRGVLPGTVRDQVARIARENEITILERAIPASDLGSLDEAFITSTTQGVMPVSVIDDSPVGSTARGPVTERLQEFHAAAEVAEWERQIRN